MIKQLVILGVMAGAGIGYYLIPADAEISEAFTAEIKPIEHNNSVVPVVSKTAEPAPATAALAEQRQESESAKVESPWQNYAHQQDLESYEHLNKKVFLTDEEKRQRQKLMQDPAFLTSLKALLLSEAPDDMSSLQNTALDYLYESLRSGQKLAAREVLQAVVQDTSVEDVNQKPEVRKAMGGIKAEVLFHWSSIEPQSTGVIEAALPGPTSKKIWARVQEQQENNLAESATLQASK